MTVSLDARTPSASVHALSGSTPPGAVMQPFNVTTAVVHEMPDTFTPLGAVSDDVVAALQARRAAAAHPDAEVIDLARRVERLAKREHALWGRRADLDDAVTRATPPRPVRPEMQHRMASSVTTVDGARTVAITEPAGWQAEHRAREAAYDAAVAEHARLEAEIGARLGVPLIEKLTHRASARLGRWGLRLVALEPQTQAGLKAKATASSATAENGMLLDPWRQLLAMSVTQDAIRLAGVQTVTLAQHSPLQRLRAENDRVVPLREAAYEAWTAIEDKHEAQPLPDALRFRAETDASAIGSYQNHHKPFGYTDPHQIETLRTFPYSRAIHIARRDEIVTAYDQWAAACQTARVAAGVVAARDHFYALSNAASAVRRRVIDTRAATVDDIWHKVAVILECFDGTKGIEEEMAEGENQTSATREVLGLSILLDLGRMLESQEAGQRPSMSNVVPTDLPRLPVGVYPVHASREVVESYRTFLDMELRFLNWETHQSPDAIGGLWLDNPAGSFHGGETPPPSTRAAAVLGALGLMPDTSAEDERVADVRAA